MGRVLADSANLTFLVPFKVARGDGRAWLGTGGGDRRLSQTGLLPKIILEAEGAAFPDVAFSITVEATALLC